jgi:hypothetical protein
MLGDVFGRRFRVEVRTISMMKRPFLVAYEYGQGAVWAILHAESGDRIKQEFPELTVVRDRPSWMTDAKLAKIRNSNTYDIDKDRVVGLLAEILDARKG